MPRSEILFERAMDHIQTPAVAEHLAELVIKELAKIEGFDDLPDSLQKAIERRVAKMYVAGFVQGARWNAT